MAEKVASWHRPEHMDRGEEMIRSVREEEEEEEGER